MAEQYNSLDQKTRMVDLAMKYTNGDMEKAKAMAGGQFVDLRVVKGKAFFHEKNFSLLFILFFNVVNNYIGNSVCAIDEGNGLYEKVRIFDDWKALVKDLQAYRDGTRINEESDMSDYLMQSSIGYDLFPTVSSGDLDFVTDSLRDILVKKSEGGQLQLQVDINEGTSVEMELAGISVDVPGEDTVEDEETPKESVSVESAPSAAEARMARIEEDATYIVEGKVIVSPVKGKYINDIVIDEKIKVLLPSHDPVTQKIIAALNARDDDGNVRPIKGKLKEKVPLEKNGYVLYALVAKGILAKIVEEENVKIQMDRPELESSDPEGDKKSIVVMAVLFVLIIAAGLFLLTML